MKQKQHMRLRIARWPLRTCVVLLFLTFCSPASADDNPSGQDASIDLKKLSLEELSTIEITSVSKEASPAFRTPAAIFVLTNDDIRRSGATNIPDLLRLVPGVEVAQIDSVKYAIGIRGFEGRLSKEVLVLIDGRSRLHAAVRRSLLGIAGHLARGHRPHRGDSRSGRHHLGIERRQRRHQHHHRRAPGIRAATWSRRAAATSIRDSSACVTAAARRPAQLPRVRPGFHSRSAVPPGRPELR